METALDYTDYEKAWFTTDEPKWINRIRKWREEYPDAITILNEPEENDSCLVCLLPVKWFAVKPPLTRKMSDEQKAAFAERMKTSRQKKGGDAI